MKDNQKNKELPLAVENFRPQKSQATIEAMMPRYRFVP